MHVKPDSLFSVAQAAFRQAQAYVRLGEITKGRQLLVELKGKSDGQLALSTCIMSAHPLLLGRPCGCQRAQDSGRCGEKSR